MASHRAVQPPTARRRGTCRRDIKPHTHVCGARQYRMGYVLPCKHTTHMSAHNHRAAIRWRLCDKTAAYLPVCTRSKSVQQTANIFTYVGCLHSDRRMCTWVSLCALLMRSCVQHNAEPWTGIWYDTERRLTRRVQIMPGFQNALDIVAGMRTCVCQRGANSNKCDCPIYYTFELSDNVEISDNVIIIL